jgi:hypothetical protein
MSRERFGLEMSRAGVARAAVGRNIALFTTVLLPSPKSLSKFGATDFAAKLTGLGREQGMDGAALPGRGMEFECGEALDSRCHEVKR